MKHYLVGVLAGISLAAILVWGASVEARLARAEMQTRAIGAFLSQMGVR